MIALYDDNINNVDEHFGNVQVLREKSGFHAPVRGNKDMVPIKLQTNVLFLQTKPKWKLYSYRIDFRPELDDKRQKKYGAFKSKFEKRKINFFFEFRSLQTCLYVMKQYADDIGGLNKYIFDGTKLWTMAPIHEAFDLDEEKAKKGFKMPAVKLQDGTEIKTRFKYLEDHDGSDPISMQIYNLHLKNFQEYLKMTEFKRNFYFADQAKSCETGGHKFQVW